MLRLRAAPPDIVGGPLPGDVDGRCEADVLIIAGDISPGLVTVSKAGEIFTWDKRKGYGYGGAWLIFTGDDLSDFDTTFVIWRQDQRIALTAWLKKYCSKPTLTKPQFNGAYLPNLPAPKAYGVSNPILNDLNIKKIVPKRIGQWTRVGPQRWSKTIEWWQWNPPVPRIGRPNTAIDDTKKKAPTAQDAVQLQIRSKLESIQARQKRIADLQGRT